MPWPLSRRLQGAGLAHAGMKQEAAGEARLWPGALLWAGLLGVVVPCWMSSLWPSSFQGG